MPHFENLRLKPHKGLQAADLIDLRQINVICGPNNSGKTTVLECIASKDLRSLGVNADPKVADRLAKASVRSAGWANTAQALDQRYFQAVENAWKTRPCWFAGESQELWDPIGLIWRANFGTWASPDQALKHQFEQSFATIKAELVPPKRRLELTRRAGREQIRTDGTGLLNFLFMAKNQEESSQVRKDYDRISEAFRNITQQFEFELFSTKTQRFGYDFAAREVTG
jgi:hypothetical protein